MLPLILILGQLSTTLVLLQNTVGQSDAPDAMGVWINNLAECESGNNPNAINPHDPITASMGLLQFKKSTFINFSRKYHFFPETFTDNQILEHIYDGHVQRTLARNMIVDRYENYLAWTNCVTKHGVGLPPK